MIGDVLRRLVGRVLVQAVALRLETACLPYTSTASALVLALRLCHASSGLQLKSTLVQRSCPWTQWAPMITFLGRQCWRPCMPALSSGRSSHTLGSSTVPPAYTWTDGQGAPHSIAQAEGGEQGDLLMPALFSLAQHPGPCA